MDKLKKINTEEIKKDLGEIKEKVTEKVHKFSEDSNNKFKSMKEKFGKADEAKK